MGTLKVCWYEGKQRLSNPRQKARANHTNAKFPSSRTPYDVVMDLRLYSTSAKFHERICKPYFNPAQKWVHTHSRCSRNWRKASEQLWFKNPLYSSTEEQKMAGQTHFSLLFLRGGGNDNNVIWYVPVVWSMIRWCKSNTRTPENSVAYS